MVDCRFHSNGLALICRSMSMHPRAKNEQLHNAIYSECFNFVSSRVRISCDHDKAGSLGDQ